MTLITRKNYKDLLVPGRWYRCERKGKPPRIIHISSTPSTKFRDFSYGSYRYVVTFFSVEGHPINDETEHHYFISWIWPWKNEIDKSQKLYLLSSQEALGYAL